MDTANSRMGVGTTAPAKALHVGGAIRADQSGGGTTAAFVANTTSAASVGIGFKQNRSVADEKTWDIINNGGNAGAPFSIRALNDAESSVSNAFVARRSGATVTSVSLGPEPELYVDAINSRVGIGTTAPTATLEVSSTARLTPLASATACPTEGTIYYDSTLKKLRCYDGTAWQNCW